MEWILIIVVALIILALCYLLSKNHKQEEPEDEEFEPKDVVEESEVETNENGTVINLKGLERYGYGDLTLNAPVVPPYSFFFFIVRYRSLKNTIRFSVAVSRGFEEPRIIKYCTYDDYEDLNKERIESFVDKFDMFVDDKRFNELVCKYRKDNIVEIIKKL